MDTTNVLERLQGYLLASRVRLRQATHQVVIVGSFRALMHPSDQSIARNVAYPGALDTRRLEPWLAPLRGAFVTRGRRPAVQFIDADPDAPSGLAALLRASGYREHERERVLVTTREALRPPLQHPALSYLTISDTSPLDEVREGYDTNELGFDADAQPASDQHIARFRATLRTARAFTARWQGQPAGAGMYLDPLDGVTELAGITTLPAFRGRGVAAALTAFMANAACDVGCDLVYLTTTNPAAERVYQRVGFSPVGALLTFVATA